MLSGFRERLSGLGFGGLGFRGHKFKVLGFRLVGWLVGSKTPMRHL